MDIIARAIVMLKREAVRGLIVAIISQAFLAGA